MDLTSLKLNTVFKLKMLKLDATLLDRLCDQVMKGNKKTINAIIYKYIRTNTVRKSNDFFGLFNMRSSNRFLRKCSIDHIQLMVKKELNKILKQEYHDKKRTPAFQKIVENAITCLQKCEIITKDNKTICEEIPQWIQSNYTITEKVKVATRIVPGSWDGKKITAKTKTIEIQVDSETLWNRELVEELDKQKKIAKDVFELVDHLEYIRYIKEKINENKQQMNRPTGVMSMEEYARFLKKQWRISGDYEIDLEEQIKTTNNFLDDCSIDKHIIQHIKNNNYSVKNSKIKLWMKKKRKEYEDFVLKERYGEQLNDNKIWADSGKIMRHVPMAFDYCDETPTIDLNDFLFACISVRPKRYQRFIKKLENNKHVRIVKQGQIRNKVWIQYDYLAPKKWFHTGFLDDVEDNLYKEKLQIEDECCDVDFVFPYHSNPDIQQNYIRNFRIFCHKLGIKGLSDRQIHDPIGNYEMTNTAITSYQLYYPQPRYINKKKIVSKETSKNNYYKVYASFHHQQYFGETGWIRGGNIINQCVYETGENDMDFFIADIDARHLYLDKCSKIKDDDVRNKYFRKFFQDVLKFIPNSHALHRLIAYLMKQKRKYIDLKRQILEIVRDIKVLKKNKKNYHGNSKKAKSIGKQIQKLQKKLGNLGVLEEIDKTLKKYRVLLSEVRARKIKRSKDFLREIIKEMAHNYVDVNYYRRIIIQRDVVSYCKVMSNNLNIGGIVKIYKRGDEFMHKFYHQFKENCIDLQDEWDGWTAFTHGTVIGNQDLIYKNPLNKKRVSIYPQQNIKISQVINVALKMSIEMNEQDIFDDIFNLLYEAECEVKEAKLLTSK